MRSVEYKDVQGLIRFGFGKMTEACYLLLRIKNAPAARAWLSNAPITTAESDRSLTAALQIAFTRPGLEALGVPQKVIHGFSPPLLSRMTGNPTRSPRLTHELAHA